MNKHLFARGTLIVCLLGALYASGCASATKDIKIYTEANPRYDVGGFQSYAWVEVEGVVDDPEGRWDPPSTDLTVALKSRVDHAMKTHGFIEAPNNPDMLVAFILGQRISAVELKHDPDFKFKDLSEAPKSMLFIVLADATTQHVIWLGSAMGDTQYSANEKDIAKRLDYVVAEIIGKLPRTKRVKK